jgi:hypothetical protein
MSASQMNVGGSCLCGKVRFEVTLPFKHFVHCHCSRCRKATGSAHATNAVVDVAAFRWCQGQELVARYDLPDARSFAVAFCRECGSRLPHVTRNGRAVLLPAGSFDSDPECHPERHIQWSSRASWFDFGENLPKDG